MNRHLKDALRTSATVAGAAVGFMVLGYTGQSTDGFVHTDFTGPLGLFGPGSAEVETDILAIGNGPSDASALASLLKVTPPNTKSGDTFAASSAPNTNQPPAPMAPLPVAAGPITQQAAPVAATPVVDEDGTVDCTGAVSCLVDPRTNITTVTYSDGTMAIVQRINGMTLVAYQNVNDKTQSQSRMPAPSINPAPLPVAAPVAKPVPSPLASVAVPATTSASAAPPAVDSVPVVNPGPAATTAPSSPVPALSSSTARPRVTVSNPPQDYGPARPTAPNSPQSSAVSGALSAVREALTSVVGTVGKAVNPGASTAGRRANNDQG